MILEVKKLKRYFGGVKAVDDCSFEIEKGKTCATCGHSFTPISKEDKFCKSCLWKLYLELICDMENMFPLLCDSWRLDEGYEKVKLHRKICGVKTP